MAWRSLARTAMLACVLSPCASIDAQVGLVEVGRDIYLHACEACHGESGSGYGRESWLLKRQPPDLTRFTNSKTPFPRKKISDTVTGRIRLQPSHGPSEMPYWRTTFGTPVPGAAGATRLDALLAFVEHLQVSPYRSDPRLTSEEIAAAGAGLFTRWCSECHGGDGKGVAPTGVVLANAMPDLTTMYQRYAPPLDAARIFELIARRHQREGSPMPSWYDRSMRAGSSPIETQSNLNALAVFVASIQGR